MKSKVLYSLLIFVLIGSISCKKKQAQVVHTIGEKFGGGIIFYILVPGDVGYDANVQHGIVAAETDQSAGLVWSNTNTLVGVTNQENGQAATDKIVQTEMMCCYAAKLCKDLTLNGYDDWYLPSLGEVSLLYDKKVEIGGFGQANYWTSTEYDADQAYAFNFINGSPFVPFKNSNQRVRAIRYF